MIANKRLSKRTIPILGFSSLNVELTVARLLESKSEAVKVSPVCQRETLLKLNVSAETCSKYGKMNQADSASVNKAAKKRVSHFFGPFFPMKDDKN